MDDVFCVTGIAHICLQVVDVNVVCNSRSSGGGTGVNAVDLEGL